MGHQHQHDAEPKKETSSGHAGSGKRGHIIRAIIIWCLAAGIEFLLRDGRISSWLTQQAFLFLHSNITLERRPEFPIVVVDLSRLRSTDGFTPISGVPGLNLRPTPEYTNRKALQELISRLSAFGPAGIGIDIDFSAFTPDEGGDGAPAPGDIEFMEAGRNLKTPSGRPIPVFLGVRRTMFLQPEAWLGSAENTKMAAAIIRVPERNSHMPYEVQRSPDAPVLPSLSMSLARTWLAQERRELPELSKLKSFFIEGKKKVHWEKGGNECWITSFAVNYYSTLPSLETSRIFAEDILLANSAKERELQKQVFQKIVLIGYGTPLETYDTVVLPGEPDPVPGIYMHACAAATLLKQPLYEVQETAGYILSFLASMSATLLALQVQKRWAKGRFQLTALELLSIFFVALASILAALALVRWFNIIWLQIASLWLFLAVEFGISVITSSKHE